MKSKIDAVNSDTVHANAQWFVQLFTDALETLEGDETSALLIEQLKHLENLFFRVALALARRQKLELTQTSEHLTRRTASIVCHCVLQNAVMQCTHHSPRHHLQKLVKID